MALLLLRKSPWPGTAVGLSPGKLGIEQTLPLILHGVLTINSISSVGSARRKKIPLFSALAGEKFERPAGLRVNSPAGV
jgi:hypothetical protein